MTIVYLISKAIWFSQTQIFWLVLKCDALASISVCLKFEKTIFKKIPSYLYPTIVIAPLYKGSIQDNYSLCSRDSRKKLTWKKKFKTMEAFGIFFSTLDS